MPQVTFRRIQTPDKNLKLVQDNVQQAFAQLQQSTGISVSGSPQVSAASTVPVPFSGGNVVNISLTSGVDNLVPHGLGATPNYWVLVGKSANSVVWSPVSSQMLGANGQRVNSNSTYLNLQCSASCTVAVWIA